MDDADLLKAQRAQRYKAGWLDWRDLDLSLGQPYQETPLSVPVFRIRELLGILFLGVVISILGGLSITLLTHGLPL